jgi:hypothetical protein
MLGTAFDFSSWFCDIMRSGKQAGS